QPDPAAAGQIHGPRAPGGRFPAPVSPRRGSAPAAEPGRPPDRPSARAQALATGGGSPPPAPGPAGASGSFGRAGQLPGPGSRRPAPAGAPDQLRGSRRSP